jgi:hypothetical protein
MPVTYEINNDRHTIRTRCIGDVTFAEVIDHFRVLASDPLCPARLHVLLDLTKITSSPTTDQLLKVSDTIGHTQEKIRFDSCAIVAPSDLMFGVMRMFEVFTEGKFSSTKTFRGIGEAERWLAEQLSRT